MKRIAFIVLTTIMLLVPVSSAFAAKIGQQLTSPEAGWQRFDDNHPLIKYCGNWSPYTNGVNLYNGSANHTGTVNDCASFAFKGTKVRIIADTFNNKTKTAQISIDGVKETFNENLTTQGSTLVYEKTGLADGVHNVRIQLVDSDGYLTLDAIDLESSGTLIDNNQIFSLQKLPSNTNSVTLSWNSMEGAIGYEIKRSTKAGGPYSTIATVSKLDYTDTTASAGNTYYYIIKAVGINCITNEVSATTPQIPEVPKPAGERAILVVTLDTGLEKEFDLSMAEVQAFIAWYEGKAAGAGPASYAIDKHDNNKGPFKSRKDYVIFDKILTYEVNEYTTESK
ncbi:fibronectin type III domain-containing protein [Paenibacillus ehimensis]|uniref:fibronectin type III domain-containing protein n=1 Tax=Paenibacillus ehimensis TaxID=79264 RepID=UPI003D2AECE7